jgi:hypothetical protein
MTEKKLNKMKKGELIELTQQSYIRIADLEGTLKKAQATSINTANECSTCLHTGLCKFQHMLNTNKDVSAFLRHFFGMTTSQQTLSNLAPWCQKYKSEK